MEIVIQLEDPAPVFAQIIEQIKAAVLAGKLRPGDPVPSIRQLAHDLELNNKTVAKAYRLLERDSVLQSRGYRGTFVHPDARANAPVDLSRLAEEQIAATVRTLREAGVTDSEIRIAFADVMKSPTL